MRSLGYNTKNRQLILGYLRDNREKAATVEEIYDYLVSNGQTANITTVYRSLNRLERNKLIIKHLTGEGKRACYQLARKDGECHDHLHLQCSSCGRVIHLDCEYMEEIIEHIREHHAFDLRCEASVLFGKCDECQKAGK